MWAIKLQFHYIKGPNYHEVPCHGAIGGVTPQGKIWMSLYSERTPLPRVVEFEVPAPSPNNTFVKFQEGSASPISIEARQGVIRHVESTVYLVNK
jgi:hypothetical protein